MPSKNPLTETQIREKLKSKEIDRYQSEMLLRIRNRFLDGLINAELAVELSDVVLDPWVPSVAKEPLECFRQDCHRTIEIGEQYYIYKHFSELRWDVGQNRFCLRCSAEYSEAQEDQRIESRSTISFVSTVLENLTFYSILGIFVVVFIFILKLTPPPDNSGMSEEEIRRIEDAEAEERHQENIYRPY